MFQLIMFVYFVSPDCDLCQTNFIQVYAVQSALLYLSGHLILASNPVRKMQNPSIGQKGNVIKNVDETDFSSKQFSSGERMNKTRVEKTEKNKQVGELFLSQLLFVQ